MTCPTPDPPSGEAHGYHYIHYITQEQGSAEMLEGADAQS